MKDKVQKIRNEVERLRNELIQEREKGYGSDVDDACILELQNVLTYIDSLQEEPVSEDLEEFALQYAGHHAPYDSCMQEVEDAVKAGAKWQKKHENPVSEDLEEAAKHNTFKYVFDKNVKETLISELKYIGNNSFKDGAKWQKEKDESTTEDLGEYINELSKQFPEVSFAKLSRIAVRVANWQKEQFEKNRLKHCDSITNEQAELEQGFVDQHIEKFNRMPTFLDAIEYGMQLQKEQIIKDATEVTVHIDAGNYPYIPQMELYDYDKDVPLAKEGDKYKVVLIKDD